MTGGVIAREVHLDRDHGDELVQLLRHHGVDLGFDQGRHLVVLGGDQLGLPAEVFV
jgi:hypothetical protein